VPFYQETIPLDRSVVAMASTCPSSCRKRRLQKRSDRRPIPDSDDGETRWWRD